MIQDKGSFGSLLTRLSMRRPVAVLVLALGIVLAAVFSLGRMRKDVLPDIDSPTIYVAQSYGGMQPAQMEAYITSLYEAMFQFISGVRHVESKSIQSTALIKLEFYPGTDMAKALAQVTTYVNRAKATMPPGTVPPFIMQFGVANLPVGDLVFTARDRSLAAVQNYAMNEVLPMFARLPGLSAAAPFGGNSNAVVISVDAAKLRRYNLSADDVVRALERTNLVSPSGNIRAGGMVPVVALNSVVDDVRQLEGVALRPGNDPSVFLGDVATVARGGDIQTGYALVDGRRTIYIPVTKQDQASTLQVVDEIKAALPMFQAALPPDVHVSFRFDQSGYVRRAIGGLVVEGVLGALLTGLVVLLFLGDWRSAVIVVLNIPLAVLAAVTALWATGQTVNIMTLGGLALAIGVLVDETTVTIENIHTHLARGVSAARASLDATAELFLPKLFTLLAFLVVFAPAFFMTGIPRDLFVPLALAVGFTLTASFLLSATFVPVLAGSLLPRPAAARAGAHGGDGAGFAALRRGYASALASRLPRRGRIVALYLAATVLLAAGLFGLGIGREIFPGVDEGQFQVRFRAATGTDIEHTEAVVLKALDIIKRDAGGAGRVSTTVAYVGAQSYNLPVNSIYEWTSGPQEAVLDVALSPHARVDLEGLRERLRRDFAQGLPGVAVSFEASGLVGRTMSGGSPTPIEVTVSGFDFPAVRAYAARIRAALALLPQLRDLQYGQALDYPSLRVDVDRRRAGVAGFTMLDVSRALIPATSSSRFEAPVFWADASLGTSFIIQAQIPQGSLSNAGDLRRIPVGLNGASLPLGEIARVSPGTIVGEFDHYDRQRTLSLTANLHGLDLGRATTLIEAALAPLLASKPSGVSLAVRGQSEALASILRELGGGLALAMAAVLLLLTVNFESLRLALVVVSTAPAVLAGVAVALAATRTTLNIESYMGTIMAVGVAMANSILLVTFAERERLRTGDAVEAALEGARGRMRPILMTSAAMAAGMVPMALGITEGGQQTAPLGLAVLGGLAAATLATLGIVPMMFALVQSGRPRTSSSMDPDDPDSPAFEGKPSA